MSTNDVTGDAQKTKASSEAYRDGWDLIWGNGCVADPEYAAEQKRKNARFRAMLDSVETHPCGLDAEIECGDGTWREDVGNGRP